MVKVYIIRYPWTIYSNLMSQCGLKFLHLHVCSLLPKVDEIWLLLLHYKDIDFFFITQTHLSSHISDDEIGIQGYIIYRLDPQAQSKGGGVVVYVRDCVSVSRHFDLESNAIVQFGSTFSLLSLKIFYLVHYIIPQSPSNSLALTSMLHWKRL